MFRSQQLELPLHDLTGGGFLLAVVKLDIQTFIFGRTAVHICTSIHPELELEVFSNASPEPLTSNHSPRNRGTLLAEGEGSGRPQLWTFRNDLQMHCYVVVRSMLQVCMSAARPKNTARRSSSVCATPPGTPTSTGSARPRVAGRAAKDKSRAQVYVPGTALPYNKAQTTPGRVECRGLRRCARGPSRNH